MNSSHHQAVAVLGDGLVRAAWSPDDGVVEAAEGHGDQFLMGVQWHPERVLEENKAAQCLFQSLCGCGGGVGAADDQRIGRGLKDRYRAQVSRVQGQTRVMGSTLGR